MAENADANFNFSMGVLPQTYSTQQDFANAIADNLVGRQIVPPKAEPGQAGKSGTIVTKTTREIVIEEDSAFQDAGEDIAGAIVQLYNVGPSSETPTAGISAIRGNIVYFTVALPTANYRLKITTITLSNPTT